jgi:hypothetical protein
MNLELELATVEQYLEEREARRRTLIHDVAEIMTEAFERR